MEELLKQGWGISEDGFEVLKSIREDEEDQNLALYDIALDTDLSKISSRPLTEEVKKNLQYPTPLILQVKSVKNLGAPSISQNNSSSPRLLQVVLTDGKSSLTLLELRKSSKFTIETWPGTKVRLTGKMPQSGNYLEIDDSKIDILGGEVDALIEKWLVDKDSQNSEFRVKTFEQGGPPVFVPFEKRNAKHNKNKIGTEDLSGKRVFNKDEDSDSEGEFEEQRAADLAKIETARLKFAKSRSLGVLPNNQRRDFENKYQKEVNQRSSQSSAASTPVPAPESKHASTKKPAPPKSSYYKALPTASGLELDKQKVKMLVEMGFQQADCIQAMQEADNDMELALDGLQSLSLSARESSRDDNSRPTNHRGRGGKRGRRGRNNFEEEEKTRPQGSLMDFIGGDLPQSSKTNQEAQIKAEIQQINPQNNDRPGSKNDRGGHFNNRRGNTGNHGGHRPNDRDDHRENGHFRSESRNDRGGHSGSVTNRGNQRGAKIGRGGRQDNHRGSGRVNDRGDHRGARNDRGGHSGSGDNHRGGSRNGQQHNAKRYDGAQDHQEDRTQRNDRRHEEQNHRGGNRGRGRAAQNHHNDRSVSINEDNDHHRRPSSGHRGRGGSSSSRGQSRGRGAPSGRGGRGGSRGNRGGHNYQK